MSLRIKAPAGSSVTDQDTRQVLSLERARSLSRTHIVRRDGTPSSYFWSDDDLSAATCKRVYRETPGGVERMRGVRFDSLKKRMHRRPSS